MNEQNIVVVENLYKHFMIKATHKKIEVLKNINLTIPNGKITALIGPDGAGKTTFMRLVCGLLLPSEGSINVLGLNTKKDSQQIQNRISYMPQKFGLYEDLTIIENLNLYADLHAVPINEREERFNRLLKMMGLDKFINRRAGKLSGGMKQKLGLACTLVRSPEFLLLDEPTTGLDPNQLVEIRDLIKNIGKDKTVFLSTHIMQEVEAICDRIIIIDKGKIVTDKKLNNLVAEEAEQIIEVEFDKKVSEYDFTALSNLKSAKNTHDLVWELTFTTATDMRPALFDFAQANHLRTLQIVLKSKNLEQIFREKTTRK